MNILLSAYACEPEKGSEPGVGWSWAVGYAKFNNVWVLTKENNRENIERYISENPNRIFDNIHFVYVDLPKKLTWWKRGRRGIRLYYMLWQRKALRAAEKIINEAKIDFNFVQHITFVSCTQPCYLYKLKLPLVWGPVAGGENIPSCVDLPLSFKYKLIESIRYVSQKVMIKAPSVSQTMRNSRLIFAATEDTERLIPNKYRDKTHVMPAIGIAETADLLSVKSSINISASKSPCKIVMAGRLIYWKAFDIGLSAIRELLDEGCHIELHILGEGKEKKKLELMASGYLNEKIFFDNKVPHAQIYKYFSQFDVFLNTTLRDSGCMTMMEAMTADVPCISIATGGPKELLKLSEKNTSVLPGTVFQMKQDIKASIINNMKNMEKPPERKRKIPEDLLLESRCRRIIEFMENYQSEAKSR